MRPPLSNDEFAVQRYEYLLHHARTHDAERVHTKAFAMLTEDQRDLLFDQLLTRAAAPAERPLHTPRTRESISVTRKDRGRRRWFGQDRHELETAGDSLLALFVAYGPGPGIAFPFFWI